MAGGEFRHGGSGRKYSGSKCNKIMEKEENMNSESRKYEVLLYREKRISETNKEITEKLVGLITRWQRRKLVE
jgi:hypothetical protein